MTDKNERTNQLIEKLETILKKQNDFSKEINELRFEINSLKNSEQKQEIENLEGEIDKPIKNTNFTYINVGESSDFKISQQHSEQKIKSKAEPVTSKNQNGKSNLEKFIGENLINKIGIAITIIGVAIGAKYSIDNGLISPLTRIILGYIFGLGLLGFGIKLKSKYENYSAVLVSGAMSILYFITYSAYGMYNLFPQIVAFIIMVIFTIFTVIAAINYNKQIIAHIGLVGAYAVPFLLGDGSGKISVLFSYMAILNIGILALAIKKYWKPLYYASFGLTWIIFLAWYVTKYQSNEHFGLALGFISIFYAIFYLTFLSYKLIQKEKFVIDDIILLMINSFVFYAIGYLLLEGNKIGEQLLGLFTLFNAVVHFIVSVIIYRQKLADKNIHYLITGLVLIFITIAVPVQLNGNWVTFLWASEAALLFWIGRTKAVSFYEKLSYPLMLIAFFSLLQDWAYLYNTYNIEIPTSKITLLFNLNFLSSILFIASFLFINILNRNEKYPSYLEKQNEMAKIISFALPAILIFTIYFALRMEIANYWDQLYTESSIKINSGNLEYPDYYWNSDLLSFKSIWIINYSLLFVSILTVSFIRKFESKQFDGVNFWLIGIALIAFLSQGLFNLSELSDNYIEQPLSQYYHRGTINLWIRYISFAFVSFALYSLNKYIKKELQQKNFQVAFELLLHTTILCILSSELINWMDILNSDQSNKLGLSILWGSYSLFLIALGIWKKNKIIRYGAFALFGITLIKLFFYDISHLNTIAKTIVLVSLGILLLIISFLYNKYKHMISDEETEN